MRVITLNLNGIRSASSKGALDWLATMDADVILLQEVRAQSHHLPDVLIPGYHAFWNLAQKPGYSGVGVLTRLEPRNVVYGIGKPEFDAEGRVLRADFEGWSAASVYVPSGSSGEERQKFKMLFLDAFLGHTDTLNKSGQEIVIGGDFNIAHKEIDLKNWRANQKNSGFLPDERAWVDALLGSGWHDTFRDAVGADAVHYSWWSNRGRARENDVGWRLDYQFSTPGMAGVVQDGSIYKDQFFSDHAPVVMNFDFAVSDLTMSKKTAKRTPKPRSTR
jgi:exodeoxyribonuclease III